MPESHPCETIDPSDPNIGAAMFTDPPASGTQYGYDQEEWDTFPDEVKEQIVVDADNEDLHREPEDDPHA